MHNHDKHRWVGCVIRAGLLTLAAALTGGCEFKGGLFEPTGEDADNAQVWRITPVRLRVYPSTGFVRSAGQVSLDARIELFDEAGDTVKGVGVFRFELYTNARPGEPAMGTRLYAWEVPVRTLAQNSRQYDPITRTYLCKLKLDGSEIPGNVVLLTTFLPVGGGRLETRALLTPEGVRAQQD